MIKSHPTSTISRRSVLTAGGVSLLGATLGACAPRGARESTVRPHRRANLEPVDASWDRVIRTTVGLRPHRPSGFVVSAEQLGERTLIHNYGHGGAGHSLGWGTGYLAAELALAHTERRAAVIGCGTVGLTAARQMQGLGFTVTIYAKSVPPDTTSNMALAGFTPLSGLVATERRTPAWEAQFRRAAEISYTRLQLLVGTGSGVSWVDTYSFASQTPREQPDVDGPPPLLPRDLQTGREILGPGDHPFPSTYAIRRPSLRIEPSVYLGALVRDFLTAGGRIVIRTFDTRDDLATLSEPLIVNCTGLGSRSLVDDDELEPVKGQLTVLVPQPDVDYATFGGIPGRDNGGRFPIHMMPRRDGIALGGTSQPGVWDLQPDDEARQRIVEAHIALFAAMRT